MGLMASQAGSGQGLSGAGMGRQRSMLPSSSAKLAHVMLRVQEAPQKGGLPLPDSAAGACYDTDQSLLLALRMRETPLPSRLDHWILSCRTC